MIISIYFQCTQAPDNETACAGRAHTVYHEDIKGWPKTDNRHKVKELGEELERNYTLMGVKQVAHSNKLYTCNQLPRGENTYNTIFRKHVLNTQLYNFRNYNI